MSSLVCLGRHTVTGLLSTSGLQFRDWTAAYRLFAWDRIDMSRLFSIISLEASKELPHDGRVYLAMDDSQLRKTGKHIHGVAWRRDPLGPPFHTNFIRAQRILQISLAVPQDKGASPARLIPIDFAHLPSPVKPRHNASNKEWNQYKKSKKESAISRLAVPRLQHLYKELSHNTASRPRETFLLVDGRFTNRIVLKGLPTKMRFIGRIRKDAKLYFEPSAKDQQTRGRRRLYGELAPTPEQLRQDAGAAWQTVKVFAAGKVHGFRIKTQSALLWRPAGGTQRLRLIVIAPLGYRPRKNSRVLYRQPGYLITNDCVSSLQDIVQSYVWRWEIEVNLRDEKTLLGVGQAQVRNPASTENVPAMIVASYALLLLAGLRCNRDSATEMLLPPAKWRCRKKQTRTSTQSLRNQLRAEMWGRALGLDYFSGFSSASDCVKKPEKLAPSLPSAVLYAA